MAVTLVSEVAAVVIERGLQGGGSSNIGNAAFAMEAVAARAVAAVSVCCVAKLRQSRMGGASQCCCGQATRLVFVQLVAPHAAWHVGRLSYLI